MDVQPRSVTKQSDSGTRNVSRLLANDLTRFGLQASEMPSHFNDNLDKNTTGVSSENHTFNDRS